MKKNQRRLAAELDAVEDGETIEAVIAIVDPMTDSEWSDPIWHHPLTKLRVGRAQK